MDGGSLFDIIRANEKKFDECAISYVMRELLKGL